MSPEKRKSRSSSKINNDSAAPISSRPTTQSQSAQKVFFLNSELLKSRGIKAVQLRHPRTDSAAMYFLSVDSSNMNIISEVNVFDEGNRSWFMGESIISDGKIYLGTPYNAVYLILPYLMKAEQNVPLDQLLEDEEFPSAIQLASCSNLCLKNVADAKGSSDLNVWKYNEKKTLSWLEARTRNMAAVLMAKKVPTTTAQALTFVRTMDQQHTKEAYLQLSHGIISEYLPPLLSEKLRVALDLPDPSKHGVKQKATHEAVGQKDQKKPKLEGPLEDYTCSPGAANKVSPPLSAKAKALARSAVGTKSIMSFFAKK
ncbi:ribonuclease H2 subunit B [Hyalella azteca]|uniref:Ribonuclease H2 subunit B n=1 Tax=Hyalella azteca TaxID=294128 RepID=A0A8B7P3P0_HYAAZ|nr:ribonuclease H2 subunit B [Hyalella azteca]